MFDDEPRPFTVLPHGNSKNESSMSFKRTQKSTIELIKKRLIFGDLKKASDHVAEEVRGILTC